MTSSKSVSWSALVNIGNNESIALTVSGEAATPDEARDIFVFACEQLLGVANSADVDTAAMILAYVSRLILTEEARPVVAGEPAPAAKKAPWEPKITKSSYDKMQEERKSAPTPPPRVPTAKEQAAAAAAQCIKPPTPSPAPSAPPVAKASASTTPPDTKTAPLESFGICAECGEAVPQSQAKLSQIFMSKTLCKDCMGEVGA